MEKKCNGCKNGSPWVLLERGTFLDCPVTSKKDQMGSDGLRVRMQPRHNLGLRATSIFSPASSQTR